MIETEPFDAARYLTIPEAQAELLNDALASGTALYVAQAVGLIAAPRSRLIPRLNPLDQLSHRRDEAV